VIEMLPKPRPKPPELLNRRRAARSTPRRFSGAYAICNPGRQPFDQREMECGVAKRMPTSSRHAPPQPRHERGSSMERKKTTHCFPSGPVTVRIWMKKFAALARSCAGSSPVAINHAPLERDAPGSGAHQTGDRALVRSRSNH